MFYVNKMTLHWQKMVPGENWSYARVVINQKKKKKRINNTFSSYSRTVGLLLTFTICSYWHSKTITLCNLQLTVGSCISSVNDINHFTNYNEEMACCMLYMYFWSGTFFSLATYNIKKVNIKIVTFNFYQKYHCINARY